MSFPQSRRALFVSPRAAGLITNFVAFQCGWLACVLGAAHGWPFAGTAAAAAIVAWHVLRALRPAEELKLIVIALAIGVLWDSSLAALGWIDFTSGTLIAGLAPPWILALWALFATTLNVSLEWLKAKTLMAALLGAIAGPLSYWAGVRLGAIEFVAPLQAMVALAIGWGVMTPLLVAAARRYDGIHTTH
jgi:hypothetical protein